MMKFNRVWAMPNKHTFLISPIAELLKEEIPAHGIVVDPFAGFNSPANIRNDLNPDTPNDYHMEVTDFLASLLPKSADCVLVDPPYSPRQISECYQLIGKKATMTDTQNGTLIAKVREGVDRILVDGGKVIMCGWNSNGMGKGRGYKMTRILLVAHGGSHNDTIVTVEVKEQNTLI